MGVPRQFWPSGRKESANPAALGNSYRACALSPLPRSGAGGPLAERSEERVVEGEGLSRSVSVAESVGPLPRLGWGAGMDRLDVSRSPYRISPPAAMVRTGNRAKAVKKARAALSKS